MKKQLFQKSDEASFCFISMFLNTTACVSPTLFCNSKIIIEWTRMYEFYPHQNTGIRSGFLEHVCCKPWSISPLLDNFFLDIQPTIHVRFENETLLYALPFQHLLIIIAVLITFILNPSSWREILKLLHTEDGLLKRHVYWEAVYWDHEHTDPMHHDSICKC